MILSAMSRLFIRILCAIQLFNLIHSAEISVNNEIANKHYYNLNARMQESLSRYHYSRNLKNKDVNIYLNPLHVSNVLEHFQNLIFNNSKCILDILYTFENIRNSSNSWALKLFDSYGKPGSGILQGNLKWLGSYSECLNIYAPPKEDSVAGNFNGKYCSLVLGSSNPLMSPTVGVCIPDSCDPSEIKDGILKLYNTNDASLLSNVTFTCKAKTKPLSSPAIAVIALMAFFCTLAVLGSSLTATKYFKSIAEEFKKRPSLVINVPESEENNAVKYNHSNTDDEILLQGNINQHKGFYKRCEEFLECFSIFKNGAKLLNTDTHEGELLCLHGIRFLSMTWVMLGHAYAFCFAESSNLIEAVHLVDNFLFQIVLQGFFSVDSFFVLSGFLLAFLSMKEFSKTGGDISWGYFYLHRYLRLTPLYMIVLGFSASVYFYIGSGPFWPDFTYDKTCADGWWLWNMLYINNFRGMANQCMGWSWYLANDMQFFVISPLFLISLWRWPKIGFSLIAIFLCACFFANFFITYHYDLMCGVVDTMFQASLDTMTKFGDWFDKLYIKPYTRIGPYLIGILTGYLIFKRKKNNAAKHSLITLCIGWIIASVLTLTVVYGLYHSSPPLIARSFYNALNRSCFAIGLSWVMYVCLAGQGGFVNSILSFKAFIPLSRLTYTAYLIHPLIFNWYYSTMEAPLIFAHSTMVILFLGFLVVTYALSLPVSLVFESPLIGLEKMIRNSFKPQEQ